MRRIALVIVALMASMSGALAQTSYTIKDASSVTRTVKSINCSNTICPLSVPSDAIGSPLSGAAGAPSLSALTVQGIIGGTAIPITASSLPLPTGAATSANQTNGLQRTMIVDVNGNLISSTSNNLNVQCANCSGSGASAVDSALFTAGASVFGPGGGFFQTTATGNPLTNGQQGAFQVTANRALFINLRNAAGTEMGTTTNPLQVTGANGTFPASQSGTWNVGTVTTVTTLSTITNPVAATQSGTWNVGTVSAVTSITNALPTGANVLGRVGIDQTTPGTTNLVAAGQSGTWTVQPGNTANTTAWLVTGTGGTFPATQSGTWNITNISGTVSLPTGASTAAKQPALGTAGTASTDVLSVQGIASMTPLLVNPGTAANWGVGATGAVVPANGHYASINVAGTLRGMTGLALGTAFAPTIAIVDASGNQITTFGSSAAVGSTGSAVPSSASFGGLSIGGTLRGATGLGLGSTFSQTVAIVDASGNQITSFGGSGGTASNYGSAFPATGTAIGFTDGTNMVAGRVGDVNNVAAATNYLDALAIGRYNATQPTLTDTRFNAMQVSSRGELLVAPGVSNFAVQAAQSGTWNIGTVTAVTAITNALPSGTNVIGHVITDTGSTTAVTQATAGNLNATVVGTGTFATQAAQSGTWTVQPGNTANTTAWLVTGTGGTFPATQSGTWNVTNISGTVSLPTGAATAAKQPALGTAGSASTDVLTVQGIASMTPLLATVTNAGTFAVQAAQSGTWNITNVSGTVSLPTGASTAAKQPALGTAGSASTDVLSVQGIASMTPLFMASATAPVSTMNSASANSGINSAVAAVFDDTSPTAITENSFGFLRISANRNLYNSIRDAAGNERGVNVDASNRLTTAPTLVSGSVASGAIASGAVASGAFASGALASGSIAAGAQVDLLTMRGTKAAGTAAANSILAGGVYTSAGITLTDGQQAALQVTSAGALTVSVVNTNANVGNNGDAVASGASAGSPVVNYGYGYNGTTWDRLQVDGSKNLKTVISNTSFAATQSGTWTVQPGNTANTTAWLVTGTGGTFPVTATNLSTNVAQINGVTPLMGNGATGTGSHRVTLSNDNTIPTGWPTAANQTAWQSATGAAPPANAAYLGANGSGATGGLLAGLKQCDATAIYDASTSGSTELVALTSGRTIHVCGYSILSGGTVNVKLIYGTGTACATGSNNMTPAYQLTAQVGLVDGSPFARGLKTASANALCINTSAGIAVQAIVYYSVI